MSSTNNTTEICNEKLSEEEFSIYIIISWWFEYLLQTEIGIAGLFANTLAIPILCSREMNSIFNRLLIFLAIFDNLYIICSVLEGRRKHTENFDQIHEYAFGYILYPLHNFVLCCSIYITVALALERYRAVWRPVEYHNKCKGIDPWRRVFTSYVLPVVIFSIFFNIPKLFEVKFVVKSVPQEDPNYDESYNESLGFNYTEIINRTLASPTDLRLQDHYVIFYVNAARLLVQGVIPFICLSLLNYRIYWVIKRRRQLINRPPQQQIQQQNANGRSGETFSSAQRKANEAQQAIVLFIIVLLFFICHTPRFILNIHEFLTLETLRKSIEHDCNGVSVWALSFASISHCLMTLNSSVNFFIYGFMCSTFRQVLFRWVRSFASCCFRKRPSQSSSPTTADVSRYMNHNEENVGLQGPTTPHSEMNGNVIIQENNTERDNQNGGNGGLSVQFEVNTERAGSNGHSRTESNGRLETAKKKKFKSVKMEHQILDPVTTEFSISEVVSDHRFLETSL